MVFFFFCFVTRLMRSILLLCAHSAGKVLLWRKEEPTLFTWHVVMDNQNKSPTYTLSFRCV